MKKRICILCLLTLCCSGCMDKEFTCTLQKNEDNALTTISTSYQFNLFGKQQSRKEITTIQFENMEDLNYYYDNFNGIYNRNNDTKMHYTIKKNNDSLQISRNLIFQNISKESLKKLEPSTTWKRKKIRNYYENIGYECK